MRAQQNFPHLNVICCLSFGALRMLYRYLVGLMGLYLIKSSEIKCVEIANNFAKLLNNLRNTKYLSKEVYFGLNLAFKILSGNRPNDVGRNDFYWKTLDHLKVLKSGIRTPNISVYSEIVLESISENSEVWRQIVKYRHLDIKKSYDSFSNYEWFVDQGLPNTIDSDKCIAQLGSTKSCVINSKCVAIMTSDEPSYGYHKTHQLLFFVIMLLKGCSTNLHMNRSIDFIINEKCSNIHHEHSIMLQQGVPIEYRDLFIEQTLFCGMVGYSEFLTRTTVNLILLWQSNDGCFGEGPIREGYLELKCMNHINSLAVALFSNIIATGSIF